MGLHLSGVVILSKLIEKSLFVSTHLQLDFKLRASSSYSEKDGLGATTWVSVDKNAIFIEKTPIAKVLGSYPKGEF